MIPFQFVHEELQPGIDRYRLMSTTQPMSFAELLERWEHDSEFVEGFGRTLGQSRFTAFRWELPGLTRSRLHHPAEICFDRRSKFGSQGRSSNVCRTLCQLPRWTNGCFSEPRPGCQTGRSLPHRRDGSIRSTCPILADGSAPPTNCVMANGSGDDADGIRGRRSAKCQ